MMTAVFSTRYIRFRNESLQFVLSTLKKRFPKAVWMLLYRFRQHQRCCCYELFPPEHYVTASMFKIQRIHTLSFMHTHAPFHAYTRSHSYTHAHFEASMAWYKMRPKKAHLLIVLAITVDIWRDRKQGYLEAGRSITNFSRVTESIMLGIGLILFALSAVGQIRAHHRRKSAQKKQDQDFRGSHSAFILTRSAIACSIFASTFFVSGITSVANILTTSAIATSNLVA
ncbi:hypothetical protein BDD12DRAFT_910224 [Trichophaea hybrida]|nr:hypothetical protein BDD12DRAFT_910224 [Trichophaea hybrida]